MITNEIKIIKTTVTAKDSMAKDSMAAKVKVLPKEAMEIHMTKRQWDTHHLHGRQLRPLHDR